MRKRMGIALALAVAAAGCGDSPRRERAQEPRRPEAVRLAGCWMTVHLFRTPVARVRRLVPASYVLGEHFGPDHATLAIWFTACDRVDAGREPAAAVLGLVGVQVAPPDGAAAEGEGPASFHHYLLGADTNSPTLRTALRAAGQPARLVPRMAFQRGAGARAVDSAPRGGYVAAVQASALEPSHSHANAFWFGSGERRAGFELRVPEASDRYCLRSGRGCVATVLAPPGSLLWRLLGERTPAHATTAFDHLRIRTGELVPL